MSPITNGVFGGIVEAVFRLYILVQIVVLSALWPIALALDMLFHSDEVNLDDVAAQLRELYAMSWQLFIYGNDGSAT